MTTSPVTNAAAGDGFVGQLDDFSERGDVSHVGTRWRLVTDQVMGGVSEAAMQVRRIAGRRALCLTGRVSLDNNGGFVQVTLDLSPDGYLDASAFDGVRLVVLGNGERYNLHLKTAATTMPWQSYRAQFDTGAQWTEWRIPFDAFRPHRLVPALDRARLRRVGIVAIGRPMQAECCIAEISLYRNAEPASEGPTEL
jgi:hypothetical protein